MDFPSTEKTFYLDHTTEFGFRYEGNFTVKCLLSLGEKHRLESEKSRLLGNSQNPTDELYGLSVILANLRAKIVDAPNWWTQSRGGELLKEEEIAVTLYSKVQDAEIEWKKDLLEKARLAKETNSIPQSTT